MITVTECDDVIIYIKIENLLLRDVCFIFKCTLNLILLEQLQHNNIIYQDKNSKMTLTKDEHIVVSIQWVENLFILNIVRESVIMIV